MGRNAPPRETVIGMVLSAIRRSRHAVTRNLGLLVMMALTSSGPLAVAQEVGATDRRQVFALVSAPEPPVSRALTMRPKRDADLLRPVGGAPIMDATRAGGPRIAVTGRLSDGGGFEPAGSWLARQLADAPAACPADRNTYDPADFARVLEDFDQTTTLRLDGSEWNDTLVRNCRIHDTGGDGIYIRNVSGVVIHNCEVWNVDKGIKTSSTGRTRNVVIDGNHIHDVQENGINAGQRTKKGIDQENLRILNNRIENTGLGSRVGRAHGIYVQARDFRIEGNSISGRRDGNGISVRSSGMVRCNRVSGVSTAGKPGIRYYSDHQTGPTGTLLIEHNEVSSDTIGIQLYAPVDRYDGKPPPDHVVKRFVIRHNKVVAPEPIRVAPRYNAPPYNVLLHANQ